MPADLVLLSARLLDPGTGGLLPHTALAAGNGVITHLGDDRTARALAGPGSTVVDLRGAVVTPGFTDGHLHPVSGAERTMGVDLSGCRDLTAVRAALAAAVTGLRPGAWLRGWGLDPNAFGGEPVGAAALGPVLDGVPALVDLFDGHSLLASARALELAGVDGPREFAQGSEIVCDADGRPTGLLLEDAACELVEAVAPRPTDAEVRARTAEVLRGMAASGLTGGHAMDANGPSLSVYAALEAEDALPLRLRVAPWCRPEADDDAVAGLVRAQGTGGTLWRVDGVKLFMDGTIDNGTAWLETPDCHGESDHAFWPDPQRYTQVVAALHRAGVPTATHAIGDAAVRHVLDSVEKALAGDPAPVRHRVEHIETVPDDTVRRFARLGVAASMQPTHCCEFTRADHTDNWSRRLGEERAGRAFRCRDLWAAGARVVLGSDWPIAPYPPLQVMAGARHRRPADLSLPPHGPGQALTPLQALQGITLNAAWVAGEEHLAGRLAAGHRADLTVLAGNPLEVPDDELAGLPVVLTVVAGRPTHRAAGL
ncbi:amidohydrolase [Streptomyces collinus]|uniref:Putative peptidase M38 family protein n=1 Tax=Streptomyces collinus (strain DSM 40733 / Tue 365) TaxID=1214242 RepID=S5VC06_STRC3|nr:amidohydrolase [Streptomyces collinus]AGS68072.1 putative peptidase M38 family protein [Streptomyces collinus Tu 365]UJA06712.1 amidohydrolase [Streptomyces collinus]UJA13016.1 amidohydrolase [Streptomyces collinus]UJA18422.1 amidohydrolase [Streptomyces collinus]